MAIIRNLGISAYQEVWQQMRDLTAQRNENTPDEIWLLEHFPVFTQGQAGKFEHILDPGEIPVIQTDRGGQVTYHGPGQLMIYLLINLQRQKIGVKKFVNILEQTIIELLATYDIKANTKPKAPGVYVSDAKIASIGLKIKHGCSYHGIALNVNMDLEPFSRINPCGFHDLNMTQIKDFVNDIDMSDIKSKIGKKFSNHFRRGGVTPPLPKPPWIRSQLPSKDKIGKTEDLLRENHLVTVCEAAACPNRGECFGCGTATFMLMGDICTRNCRFCNVKHGKPQPLDSTEPEKLAQTIKTMQLQYVVLTSVDRDDVPDGGANHFVACINAIKKLNPEVKIEILTPDFKGYMVEALDILAQTNYEVFNHNLETVPRLYTTVCPSADYQLSLNLLLTHKKRFPEIPTKTGLMLGLGETDAEIEAIMLELKAHQVERLTLGQYLQPTKNHLPVARYVTPEQFDAFANLARKLGFTHVASGPMVRSSYHAEQQTQQ